MKITLIFLLYSISFLSLAGDIPYARKHAIENRKIDQPKTAEGVDTFFDPKVDYSIIAARVTDRDDTGHVYKLWAENKNYKFFRAGDPMEIEVKTSEGGYCRGFVRRQEDDYIVIYVQNVRACWDHDPFFRRGTQLIIHSKMLRQRIHDASVYRLTLLKRRDDFTKQLKHVNNFLWNFDEERIRVATEYDKKIAELKSAKDKAFGNLLVKKQDNMRLQRELLFQLSTLDKDLENYRIENAELFSDRWHLDHDLNNPVGKRPQALKQVPKVNKERY